MWFEYVKYTHKIINYQFFLGLIILEAVYYVKS
jgi:hypothetical protein